MVNYMAIALRAADIMRFTAIAQRLGHVHAMRLNVVVT